MQWTHRSIALLLALSVMLVSSLSLSPCVAVAGDEAWRQALPGYDWSFPSDHWSHPGYRSEWWYLTGIVESDAARFGYQFTFFRIGLVPGVVELDSRWAASDLVMGHASISALDSGEHVFSELVYRAAPILGEFSTGGDSTIVDAQAPPGTDGRWTIRWNGSGFSVSARDDARRLAIDLVTRPTRPIVRHGADGFSAKTADGGVASLYYSFTRLETRGTLTIGGVEHVVRGVSWMDKEFGSGELAARQVGWDWFSIRLDDGRDLMLYELRQSDGVVDHASGTLVGADGETRELPRAAWTTGATDHWRSASTGARYPARWSIEIPDAALSLDVVPELSQQENVSKLVQGLAYWEGAVRVLDSAGRRIGEGYVELTGYGGTRRPSR